jgi:hypothetical protein
MSNVHENHEHHDRRCAQCGAVIPADADRRKLYCDKVCKRNFHNVSQCRGQEIMAFLEAQRKLCNKKPGKDPDGYDIQRFARQQIGQLLGDYLRQDKASGRDASLVVKARMDEGVYVMDKRRAAKPKLSAKPWFMEKDEERA